MEQDNKFLGTEKISKLLLKFSIPCILSLIISSLYNIVDQIYIGNSSVGYLGNAATSIVFPIIIISHAIAWCLGDGAAAFLSICQGRKDTKNAHVAIGNAIIVTFVLSLVYVLCIFIFMDKLLFMFGASEATIGLAKDYFSILLIFMPIYMLGNAMNGIIRADGSPGMSMAATVTGAITNIILDPIFIFGLNLGIKGAAWATIIGQVLTFLVEIFYYTRSKTFRLKLKSFKINWKLLGNVVKLGISTFITQMSIVIISFVCNMSLAKYGVNSKYGIDIPIATMGICMKIFSIILSIAIGLIVGAQPILGYNIGAKNLKRVKKTFLTVLVITIIIGIIATLVIQLFPQYIVNIFGSESDLYNEFAIYTFRIFLATIMFTLIIKIIAIFFQAVGEPLKATIISLIRDLICFVPIVLIIPNKLGIMGVLWSAPIADILGLLVATTLIIVFFKNINKLGEKQENNQEIQKSKEGVIITISRQHGSQGKAIGEIVAKQLSIPYYYKEMTAIAAKESGLDKEFVSKINQTGDVMHELYLTTQPVKYAIEAQQKVIQKIAENGSCVLVGRAADYILKENPNLVKVFIYAPKEYRIKKVMEMYGDSEKQAPKSIEKSDKNRSSFYTLVTGQNWGNPENYDLCIDSSIGKEETAKIICEYAKMKSNK